ncbi:MAG: hypothetical protein ACOYLX_23150, partial [Burkholderiaceae bacterium]
MRRTQVGAGLALAFMLAAGSADAAERTLTEFWPELDVFVKLGERHRLFLLGTITRAAETGTSTESTLGAHLDWFPESLPSRLLEIAPGLADQWTAWTRIGIQHISVPNGSSPSEQRLVMEATLRSVELWQSIRIANRIRVDLRAIGDDTSWRFRDRLRVERTWTMPGDPGTGLLSGLPKILFSAVTPYAMIESFWDSRDDAWSRRFVQVGVEVDVARDRTLDLFLAQQKDLR